MSNGLSFARISPPPWKKSRTAGSRLKMGPLARQRVESLSFHFLVSLGTWGSVSATVIVKDFEIKDSSQTSDGVCSSFRLRSLFPSSGFVSQVTTNVVKLSVVAPVLRDSEAVVTVKCCTLTRCAHE